MFEREMEEVIQKLSIFERTYDKVRLIDPLSRTVIDIKSGPEEKTPEHCFDFWKKGELCDNCIAMRALREKDTFMKLEYLDNKIFLVIAMPIELSDRTVVLELMKDATKSISIHVNGENASVDFNILLDSLTNRAIIDSLTGIYNRRYINEKLPLDLINANMSGNSISVIMVDIDYFKTVNDTYGHLIGDETLKSLAVLLQHCLKRESDWVARYGGEEFLICLPGAPLHFARELAESIRQKVESTPIECGEQSFHITASLGVSAMVPKPGNTMNELIENADKKLYEAKRNGRNRVE